MRRFVLGASQRRKNHGERQNSEAMDCLEPHREMLGDGKGARTVLDLVALCYNGMHVQLYRAGWPTGRR